jgi:phage baseplate assembly protein W
MTEYVNNGKTVSSENIYSDLNLSFTPHPITGDITRKTDVDAVKRSVRNIVSTNSYERPFKPNFGVNLRNKLFELDTSVFGKGRVANDIARQIEIHEPRVRNVKVLLNEVNRNELSMQISFKVINSLETEELEYVLTRTR